MKNNFRERIKTDFNIIVHFLKLTKGISKLYIPLLIASSMFRSAAPIINIIMPKFIIDEILGYKRLNIIITLILITILSNTIINLINNFLDTKLDVIKIQIIDGFDLLIGKKIVNMDFQNIEDPEILNLKERAIYPIKNQDVIEDTIRTTIDLFTDIITIISVITIIITLNFYIVLLIIAIVMLNSFIYKKTQNVQYQVFKDLVPTNRAFFYYLTMTNDFSIAKDIRLYRMSPLILRKIKEYNKTTIDKFSGLFKTTGKYNGLSNINLQFQMLVIYGYMAYEVFISKMSIGSFTMYVSAASTFSTNVAKCIKEFIKLRQLCRYLGPYIEFEQIKSNKIESNSGLNNIKNYNIEFKDVSFKYPKSNDYTLKNISIKISYGEKLSIVGLNGSGKTTFIKLLTRLYEPTEGEILLNGINIKNYDYKSYMKTLAVVFQDFKIFAFSIKENISLTDYKNIDCKKIYKALKKSGLKEDTFKLENGIDTNVYKTFEKDGIELSGGQAQKLAISRALYKETPILILDEPTAALDPISEFEIYNTLNKIIKNKTVIYISHRLSSCKFCDKIAVFDKGKIIEYGCHKELVSRKGSLYNKMYMAQAQYYS